MANAILLGLALGLLLAGPALDPPLTPTPARPVLPTPSQLKGGVLATMTPVPRISRATSRPQPDRSSKAANNQPDGGVTPPASPFPALFGVSLLALLGGLGLMVLRDGGPRRLAQLWVVQKSHRNSPAALAQKKQEAELNEIRQQQKADRTQLTALAKLVAGNAVDIMTGVGYCWRYKNAHGKKKVQKPTFTHAIVVGQELILLRLGTVPYGRNRWQLFANAPGASSSGVQIDSGRPRVSWMAAELRFALGRQVEIVYYDDLGIFFQISLKHGISGVPKRVLWRDPDKRSFSMMDGDPLNDNRGAMPDEAKRPETRLYLPVGLGRNRTVIRGDMRRMPHLIVLGATDSGKSNFLTQTLCTWLLRNRPETLLLDLIDLKVVEFSPYLPLLDVGRTCINSIALSAEDAVITLHNFFSAVEKRQKMFAEGGVINIAGWNSQNPRRRLPYRVLIFDELSLVMLNKDRSLVKEATLVVDKLLAVGRAFGLHMILCTQGMQRQVVNTLAKINIPARMVFRCAERNASIQSLGDQRAWTSLTTQGMGYFCDQSGQQTRVQTPLIFEHQRDEVIRWLLAGHADPAIQPPAIQDIWEYCQQNFGGVMRAVDIRDQFSDRGISVRTLENMVREYDDEQVDINGDLFRQVNGAGGRPRRLEPITSPHTENGVDGISIESPNADLESVEEPVPAAVVELEPEDEGEFDPAEYAWYRDRTKE